MLCYDKEVHILNEFKDEFYGHAIWVEILHFIRAESDFREFDHLIKYINNDVALAKAIYTRRRKGDL
jgi:FAD synthase